MGGLLVCKNFLHQFKYVSFGRYCSVVYYIELRVLNTYIHVCLCLKNDKKWIWGSFAARKVMFDKC